MLQGEARPSGQGTLGSSDIRGQLINARSSYSFSLRTDRQEVRLNSARSLLLEVVRGPLSAQSRSARAVLGRSRARTLGGKQRVRRRHP